MADPSLSEKVRFLTDPAAYGDATIGVQAHETHMSWVFFAGERVFKLKKPVRYPFLDFSTLELRKHYVAEEVRLNRRLAPEVYIGVRPLTMQKDDGLALGASGRTVDWLVEMRRLPEDRFLDHMIEAGIATPTVIARIAETLARFYRDLPPATIDARSYTARFAAEHAETARVLSDPGFAFDGARIARSIEDASAALEAAGPTMERRVAAGLIVDGHGDLRPEHVCLTEPTAIIDCLEFSPALRAVDPFEEIVFLGLECMRLGAPWVFPDLVRHLADALGERPPPELLRFHWRYRALLRARLALMHLAEPAPRTPGRWWPLAWRYIELAEEADGHVVSDGRR